VRLPSWLWALFAALALLALLTPNPVLTALALLALPVLMQASWRVGEVPVLAFGFGWQWLQVSLQVFWADVQGLPVTATTLFPKVVEAVWLSLAGLLLLAAGVRVGLRLVQRRWHWQPFSGLSAGWGVSKLWWLYVGAAVASGFLEVLSGFSQSIRQPLLALAEVHWVFFFLLLLSVIQSRRGYWLLLAATGWEMVAGAGFFSGFKTPLFYLVLAIFTVYAKPTIKGLVLGAVLTAGMVYLGCVWMSIKGPYREFLNQGTGQQVVLVSPQERVVKLGDLLAGWSTADLADGAERLVKRIEYVDYFSVVLSTVPAVVPYQDGLIWRRAVENLIPRLFWPGKPVLNDSDITRAYTGIMVAGANEGTSIGIGYMAESYVDFGPVGMFVPILLLGVLWGAIYAYFLSRPHPAAVNCAFAAVALMDTVGYESSATKIVAGLVLRLLFLGLLLRYVMPKVEVWLTGRRRVAPVSLAVWARERGGPQAG
jgi:hypothetical protein